MSASFNDTFTSARFFSTDGSGWWFGNVPSGSTNRPFVFSSNAPKIFHVNWFRKDEQGKFLWPGYGDNLRVLEWILDRCRGDVEAKETQIGYIPKQEDIDTTGLDISKEQLENLLSIDKDVWHQEVEGQAEFFKKFGNELPQEIKNQHEQLKKRLQS